MVSQDLQRREIFEIGVELRRTSLNLRKLVNGGKLNKKERRNFKWAGSLIGKLDLTSLHYLESDFSLDKAIYLRPGFYKAFMEARAFPTRRFLDGLYSVLKSGGSERVLSQWEFSAAEKIMRQMSKYAFSCLHGN